MKVMLALAGLCCAAPATLAAALPNPAAVNCQKLGGIEVNLNNSAGEAGFCQFGKAMIEEWTLDRATNPDPSTGAYGCSLAVSEFLAHPVIDVGVNGNPASLYCGAVGGSSLNYTDAAGNAVGICQFGDNSQIDEWTLFRGPTDSGNLALTNVLNQTCSLSVSGRAL